MRHASVVASETAMVIRQLPLVSRRERSFAPGDQLALMGGQRPVQRQEEFDEAFG